MRIKTPNDLFTCFNISSGCKVVIYQLYNTHKENFLKPFAGICGGIKRQANEILDNEYEHPIGTFYIKTSTIKVIYHKRNLQIIDVDWIG